MKAAFRHRKPRYPGDWQQLPYGDVIRGAVGKVCDEFSQRVFGYHFVKLGNLSSQIKLPSCPIRHQIAQNGVMGEQAGLVAQSHRLPYVANSIDGYLLANELDFAQDPHEILREVDRTITDNGYVIISGFNPYSLTGIGKYLPLRRGNVLHDARFFSSARVKDWLQLLGFEIVEQRHILFGMLFLNRNRKHMAAWQKWCARYCPWCSSVYVIMARKRAIPMTTIKSKWQLKPSFSPVGASMREGAQWRESQN